MIFLSMCFLVFYNYIVAQKGHYDFFFLHNYMDFIFFSLVYGFIYWLTSRTYYQIVSQSK